MSCQADIDSKAESFPVMSEVRPLPEVPVVTDISNRRSGCLRFRNVWAESSVTTSIGM